MRATTTATTSPANAARSTAIGGWFGVFCSSLSAQAVIIVPCVSATSAPVNTVTTFGAALAAAVSMPLILACANGLRTIARCSIPVSWMLSVHRVRPVMRRWSSLRRRAAPISLGGS